MTTAPPRPADPAPSRSVLSTSAGTHTGPFTPGSVLAVVALGMLGTGVGFVVKGRLVARVGSTRGSFALYVVPVVALILGAVFLDETVYPLSVAGIALVIGGAVFASRRDVPS